MSFLVLSEGNPDSDRGMYLLELASVGDRVFETACSGKLVSKPSSNKSNDNGLKNGLHNGSFPSPG